MDSRLATAIHWLYRLIIVSLGVLYPIVLVAFLEERLALVVLQDAGFVVQVVVQVEPDVGSVAGSVFAGSVVALFVLFVGGSEAHFPECAVLPQGAFVVLFPEFEVVAVVVQIPDDVFLIEEFAAAGLENVVAAFLSFVVVFQHFVVVAGLGSVVAAFQYVVVVFQYFVVVAVFQDVAVCANLDWVVRLVVFVFDGQVDVSVCLIVD